MRATTLEKPTKLNSYHVDIIKNKIEACYQKAEKYFDKKFERPHVKFMDNITMCGLACRQRIGNEIVGVIGLHETFFIENQHDMVHDTIPHEVAHLLVDEIYGRVKRPHGPEWQRMMKFVLNVEPNRGHSYDMTNINVRRQRRITYSCDCREHRVSATMHHKMVDGRKYGCKRCGGMLVRGPLKGAA